MPDQVSERTRCSLEDPLQLLEAGFHAAFPAEMGSDEADVLELRAQHRLDDGELVIALIRRIGIDYHAALLLRRDREPVIRISHINVPLSFRMIQQMAGNLEQAWNPAVSLSINRFRRSADHPLSVAQTGRSIAIIPTDNILVFR